jgi:hypothetical protein
MKDGTDDHIAHCMELLEGLRDRVPTLRSLEVAKNVVEVPTAHHFVLIATFDDLAGLQAYQDHPVHLEAATYLRANREVSASIDYEM